MPYNLKNVVCVKLNIVFDFFLCCWQGEMTGALYGSAVAYMVLKQAPKARNQLKRILKSGWTMEVWH